jgi:hypothetical protein
MAFHLVPQLRLQSFPLQEGSCYALVVYHVGLPNCHLQIPLNARVDVLFELLIIETREGLQGFEGFVEIDIPFVVGNPLRNFTVQLPVVLEQIETTDDPRDGRYLLESSLPPPPQIQLLPDETLLVTTEHDARVVNDDVSQVLEKNCFLIEDRLCYQQVQNEVDFVGQLDLMKFAAQRHIYQTVLDYLPQGREVMLDSL